MNTYYPLPFLLGGARWVLVWYSVYDKLFWGCNLPSVTPEGEHYAPEWSETELHVMGCVLRDGLRLFERNIAVVE